MAWPRGTTSILRPRQRLARGDADLRRHQVDAGRLLGHRMLDLQARVHLQKIEARLVAGALEQKLHRAGVAVAGRARNRDRRVAHARAQRRRQRDGGVSSTTF